MPDRRAVRLLISGRVQGVGYRAWAAAEADRLALAGWVRNRRDGTVEASVEGPGDCVDAFVAACRKGPPLARVADVVATIVDAPDENAAKPVRILPTV